MVNALENSIIKVSQLVQLETLQIPPYQRPYKWTARNIHQLFQDIQWHSAKQAYRLGLHKFDNLCLISHSKNSRLNNFPPEAKRAHFSANIKNNSIDSLKLYEMIKLTQTNGDWGVDQIENHEQKMLAILLHSTEKID